MKTEAAVAWRKADAAYKKADRDALTAMWRAVPLDASVRWRHGDHWRCGIVKATDNGPYHSARVLVSTRPGFAEMWVDVRRIEGAP